MKKHFYLIFIGLALLVLGSCQPKEDSKLTGNTEVYKVEDLIVNRRWKLIDLKCDKPIDYNHTGIPLNKNIHVYSQLIDCQRDDYLYFFDNYKGIEDKGLLLCDAFEKKTSSFSWGYSPLNGEMEVNGKTWNLEFIDGEIMGISYNHYDSVDLSYYALNAIYARQ